MDHRHHDGHHHFHHHAIIHPQPILSIPQPSDQQSTTDHNCQLEHISTAFQSLDTVRALHHTVVSLRSALENAHRQIDNLKKQIDIQGNIDDGKKFHQQENQINLENKNIDNTLKSDEQIKEKSDNNIESKEKEIINTAAETGESSIVSVPVTTNNNNNENKPLVIEKTKPKKNKNRGTYEVNSISKNIQSTTTNATNSLNKHLFKPEIKIITTPLNDKKNQNQHQHHHRKQMASKIDVKIKVSSNVKVEAPNTSSSDPNSSDTNSNSDVPTKDSDENSQTDENDDNESISSKINPNENVEVQHETKDNYKIIGNQSSVTIRSKSNENIEINDIPFVTNEKTVDNDENDDSNSQSEGDNSVFEDNLTNKNKNMNQEKLSTTTNNINMTNPKLTRASTTDCHEEVDDIELIFSSDDKEFPQEDLVSISEFEPWEKSGQSGTPVLVNFTNIPSDQESFKKNKAHSSKLPSTTQTDDDDDDDDNDDNDDGGNDGNDDDNNDGRRLRKSEYSMESSNSFSGEQKDNGQQTINRDDSFDTFNPMRPSGSASATGTISSSTMNRRWTNHNVLIETDISKCGIAEENILDMGRRNTCPNPPAYRPMIHREAIAASAGMSSTSGGGGGGAGNTNTGNGSTNIHGRHTSSRCPLAVKFSRNSRGNHYTNNNYSTNSGTTPIIKDCNRTSLAKQDSGSGRDFSGNDNTTADGGGGGGPKRSASAQTEISAVPEHWRSESHLGYGQILCSGFYTLPSKFVPPSPLGIGCHRYPLKICDKTQEARRVLLSDINFTSMVPELSRSADHLCQDDNQENNKNNENSNNKNYYKGAIHLKPEYSARGITPSVSLTSPGVSQWTVNENSYGTQTTQTDNHYHRGDSFDSCKSYSMSSRYSNILSKSNRSRSVPSVRCTICKQNHGLGIRQSESMHYTPRVTFQEHQQSGGSGGGGGGIGNNNRRGSSNRGSLPDLRTECTCTNNRQSILRIHGESSGSTESLLDEADDFLNGVVEDSFRKSMGNMSNGSGGGGGGGGNGGGSGSVGGGASKNRRFSENDIKRDYAPSKQSLPFLPKTPKCLKLGHLAKVITRNGRVVIGRVRYIGPLALLVEKQTTIDNCGDDQFIGLQLPNKVGDCDGTIDGRKFFECEPQHGIFVPFKKIVMAWTG